MSRQKPADKDSEISIFDEAVIYKRGDIWHFRVWLPEERRYFRQSLRTKQRATAEDEAKKRFYQIKNDQQMGRRQFSKTAKQGVEAYIAKRTDDLKLGILREGRLGTIRTHLNHWLDFIHRDTKLRNLKRLDCDDYAHSRVSRNKSYKVSKSTLFNEQATINAMMKWLYRMQEVEIDRFDFPSLGKINTGVDTIERSIFTDEEIERMGRNLSDWIGEGQRDLTNPVNKRKVIACFYLLISMGTGMRRGEARQLTWNDIEFKELPVNRGVLKPGKSKAEQLARIRAMKRIQRRSAVSGDELGDKPQITEAGEDSREFLEFVRVTIRAETSKVGEPRTFITIPVDFSELRDIQYREYVRNHGLHSRRFNERPIFAVKGDSVLSERAIAYTFDQLIQKSEISNLEHRNIVPYSFRHTFITKQVSEGLSPVAVAEFCGTSVEQIMKTYYHTTEAQRIKTALRGYDYLDGELYTFDD